MKKRFLHLFIYTEADPKSKLPDEKENRYE